MRTTALWAVYGYFSLKCDSLASGLLCFNLPIISFKVLKAKQCQGGRTAKECYQDSYINDLLKNVGCVLTNTICRQLLQVVELKVSKSWCYCCAKKVLWTFCLSKAYFFGQTTYFGHCLLQLLKYWQSQTKALNCTTTWLDVLFNDDFFCLNKEFPSVTCTASVRD